MVPPMSDSSLRYLSWRRWRRIDPALRRAILIAMRPLTLRDIVGCGRLVEWLVTELQERGRNDLAELLDRNI